MRHPTRSLLLVVALPFLVLGCTDGGDDDWCYAEDESGTVRDSVRPDTGFVCVASIEEQQASGVPVQPPIGVASPDSVRPDTMSRKIRLRTARRTDLQ